MNNINLEIKKNSYSQIFKIIQKNGPIERREIESISGLSWGTISTATVDMIDMKYIESYKEKANGRGRNHVPRKVPGYLLSSGRSRRPPSGAEARGKRAWR